MNINDRFNKEFNTFVNTYQSKVAQQYIDVQDTFSNEKSFINVLRLMAGIQALDYPTDLYFKIENNEIIFTPGPFSKGEEYKFLVFLRKATDGAQIECENDLYLLPCSVFYKTMWQYTQEFYLKSQANLLGHVLAELLEHERRRPKTNNLTLFDHSTCESSAIKRLKQTVQFNQKQMIDRKLDTDDTFAITRELLFIYQDQLNTASSPGLHDKLLQKFPAREILSAHYKPDELEMLIALTRKDSVTNENFHKALNNEFTLSYDDRNHPLISPFKNTRRIQPIAA